MKDYKELVKSNMLIAIVRGLEKSKIVDTCKALNKGGIALIEVTFDQSRESGNQDTYDAIKLISESVPEVLVGAGTVMSLEQLELAVEAGAKYIISPNFDATIVKRTKELGVLSMPGVLTPTEITEAYKAGADFVKVFPAGNFGPDYIKSIKAPISHIPMLAVGGIGLDNLEAFMATGIDGVGLGSSLVNKKLIYEGNYEALVELAGKFVEKSRGKTNE